MSLNWNFVQQLVYLTGSFLFLHFYIRKSIIAWYTLFVTVFLMAPFLFLVLDESKSFYLQYVFLGLTCWAILLYVILVKFKPYKKHVNESLDF